MFDPQNILMALGLSVAFAALLVAARFMWCLFGALKRRRYLIAAISLAGVAGIFILLAAVVVVWFTYAVAHMEKTTRTDLIISFSTVPPFLLVSIGLWLLGGKLLQKLYVADQPRDAAPTERA